MNWNRIRQTLARTAYDNLGGSTGLDYTSEAEDIAQDAIVKLIQKDNVITDDDAFKLGTKIVVDLCKDHRSKEGRRREIEAEYGGAINRKLTGQSAESLAADPIDFMAYEEMKDRLDNISPLLYHTVRWHYMEGYSVKRLAEMFTTTTDVIYKRLQRARDIVTGDNNND